MSTHETRDYERTEANDFEQPSPFVLAGFRDGDIVEYPNPQKPDSPYYLEIEIVEPSQLNVFGGANYFSTHEGVRTQHNQTLARNPNKAKIYQYTNRTRAQEAFPEALSGSVFYHGKTLETQPVQTLDQLYTMFDALERTAVSPADLKIQVYQNWGQIKAVIHTLSEVTNNPTLPLSQKAEECMKIAASISRALRSTILRLTNSTELYNLALAQQEPKSTPNHPPKPTTLTESPEVLIERYTRKFTELVNGESVEVFIPEEKKVVKLVKFGEHFITKSKTAPLDYEVIMLEPLKQYALRDIATWMAMDPDTAQINYDAEARIKILETEGQITEIENLPVGDVVVIFSTRFKKIGKGVYRPTHGEDSRDNTIGLRNFTEEQIISQIRQSAACGWNIEILHESTAEMPTMEESLTEFEEAKNFIEIHFSKLYPTPNKNTLPRLGGLFKKINEKIGGVEGLSKSEYYNRIQESEITQGQYGDCYLLAALNSLKKQNPELYLEVLARTLRFDETEQVWRVRFLGNRSKELKDLLGENGNEIKISDTDIAAWRSTGAKAELGDVIIERAYASLISRHQNKKAGQTMMVNAKGDLAFEGGQGHRALYELLGSELVQKYKIGSSPTSTEDPPFSQTDNKDLAESFVQMQMSESPKQYIVTVSTPQFAEGTSKSDSNYKMVHGYKIYYKHAYSLMGYEDGVVKIQNPHDSSKTIGLTMDEFLDSFVRINYVTVKRKFNSVLE